MVQVAKGKSWVKILVVFCLCMLLFNVIPYEICALESVENIKQIIVVNNEKGEPIVGAVFEIKNEKKEVIETGVSNELGRIEIKKTNEGKYLLEQIKTQEGYEIIKERYFEIKIETPLREEIVINKFSSEKDLADPEVGQENFAKNEDNYLELGKNTIASVSENMGNKDKMIATLEDEVIPTVDTITTSPALFRHGDVKINVTQNTESTNKFIITTIGCSGKTEIERVLFPTWSESDGQDDLYWYQGIRGSNGEFSVTVDNQDHGFETGSYNIHTYLYGLQGETLEVIKNAYELKMISPEITVSEVTNNSYKISVTGVGNEEGVTGVSFPTWSQIGGQDDLKWENGTYVGDDTWEAIINLSDYMQTFDTFISHLYICDKTGRLVFIDQIENAVKDPFNKVTINMTSNSNNPDQFTISTVGYKGESGIGKIYFPTWTERNGQDDIKWYEGVLNNDGEYSVTVDNKDHGFETGLYNVHAYIFGVRGELEKTYTGIQKLETPSPKINLTEVVANSYKVQVSGISNPQGVLEVYFPTWTQTNGQDDLRWETGRFIGNNTWEATIQIKDYNKSYDTYLTHAYLINRDGQRKYIQSAEKKIINPFLEEPLEIVVRQDAEVSRFTMNTQNCANKIGIKGVSFAVWTNRNGQDEIKWYEGKLGTSGEYVALADIEEHGFETGPYSVHAYIWGNGVENIAIAEKTFTMPKIASTIEYDKAVLNNTFKMRIKNVGNENGVTGITFPTWSRTNGKDDLRWESATYIGNHTWETTINLRNYNIIVDDFITHAYLADKSGALILAKDSVKRISQNTATIYGFYCYPLDKDYRPNPGDPTDWFGPRWGDIHEGIDIPANRYAACYSVGNGIVEKAGYFMGYGRYVRIRTTDRYGESVSFFYGHLQEINVSVGQSVSIGQKIGSVGGSGYNAQGQYVDDAYGSHLHFGAIVNSDYLCVDPEIWIDFHNPYSNAN